METSDAGPGTKEARMLFLHEVHQVRGEREDEFEAAYREDSVPD